MSFDSPLTAIPALFLAGILTSLTPCIYPMIPITAAIVGGAATGHLLIHGTKTANARRIIPHVFYLEPKPRRLANLQMRLINLDPPTAVRARDFRRTAAVWYELAGIPRSRYSYYLGHGAKDITALYEQRVPTKDELDEDRAKLLAWVKGQKKNPRKKLKKFASQTAAEFIQTLETL